MGSQSLEGKGNQRERAEQGSFWQHLKMCSNKREEVGVLARVDPAPRPARAASRDVGFGALASGLGCREAAGMGRHGSSISLTLPSDHP